MRKRFLNVEQFQNQNRERHDGIQDMIDISLIVKSIVAHQEAGTALASPRLRDKQIRFAVDTDPAVQAKTRAHHIHVCRHLHAGKRLETKAGIHEVGQANVVGHCIENFTNPSAVVQSR